MNKYEELYNKSPSQEDVIKIKNSVDELESWLDYYWAGRTLIDFDKSECDPEFLIKLFSNAMAKGLTVNEDKEKYLKTLQIRSALFIQTAQYDKVKNDLLSIIELDDDAPDWVFHDFCNCCIHCDDISRIIKNPKNFISDLKRNSNTNENIEEKQLNIVKELFRQSKIFIENNSNCLIDKEALKVLAEEFYLTESNEYLEFLFSYNPEAKAEYETKKKEEKVKAELEKQHRDELIEKDEQLKSLEDQLNSAGEENKNLIQDLINLRKELAEVKASAHLESEEIITDPYLILTKYIVIASNHLTRKLNSLFKGSSAWEKYVVKKLYPNQVKELNDRGITSFDDLDFGMCIEILQKNFNVIRNWEMLTDRDESIIQNLKLARNSWAHFKFVTMNTEYVKKQLTVIKDFLVYCEAEISIKNELNNQISKMS